jgi:hypothetical protein
MVRASVVHSGGIVMRRSMLAVIVAALTVVQGAQAKPARPGHRLALAPEFSIDVPDGFASCDAAANKLLGNAPHLIVLEQMCANLGLRKGGIILVDMDRALPVTISTLFMADFPITAEFFANPTPDVTDAMSRMFCSGLLKEYQVERCDLRPASVAGRAAFIADAAAINPLKRQVAVRAYLVPGQSGVMAVAFFMLPPATAQALAVVERVAGSLKVETLPPPAPPVLVTMTPAPGVTMSVPKNWGACDAANNALLGNIPAGASANFCAAASAPRFFNPKPPYYEFVETESIAGNNDAGLVAQMLAPAQLAKDRDQDCHQLTDPMTKDGDTVASCETQAGAVAGRPAKVVSFTATEHDARLPVPKQIAVRVIDVPLENRTVEIHVWTSGTLKPVITPAAEAIVSSVAIQ